MTAATNIKARRATPLATPGEAFRGIMNSAIGVASAKVDDWSNKLEGVGADSPTDWAGTVDDVADNVADGGDATHQAGVRGVQAGLEGKNPVWSAIKGAWSGGGSLV